MRYNFSLDIMILTFSLLDQLCNIYKYFEFRVTEWKNMDKP